MLDCELMNPLRAQWFVAITCLGGLVAGALIAFFGFAIPNLAVGTPGMRSAWLELALFVVFIGAIVGLLIGLGVACFGLLARLVRVKSPFAQWAISYLLAVVGTLPGWVFVLGGLLQVGPWWAFLVAIPAGAWLKLQGSWGSSSDWDNKWG